MVAALAIRKAPLSELVPDPANARTHGEANMAAITASLRRFGQVEPLLVQTGTGRVIAGHGRLACMEALGWTEADIIELDVDGTDAAALGIALNRTAELAGWDDEVLAKVLASLQEDGGLDGLGFSDADLAALTAEESVAGLPHPKLADRFGVPPFTVLDARQGYWGERKTQWLGLGIHSEVGRGNNGDGRTVTQKRSRPDLSSAPEKEIRGREQTGTTRRPC